MRKATQQRLPFGPPQRVLFGLPAALFTKLLFPALRLLPAQQLEFDPHGLLHRLRHAQQSPLQIPADLSPGEVEGMALGIELRAMAALLLPGAQQDSQHPHSKTGDQQAELAFFH
ncbi:hypothetical protein DBV14_18415 [Variovorax sp. KBW07]|nr:hypothetical protein DBV14_18415 [Variovorax sp. KBW07]